MVNVPTVREAAEQLWQGQGDLVGSDHPLAGFGQGRAEELDDGILYLKSLSSVTALDTGAGLVLLDTGGQYDTDTVFDAVRRWRPATRLAAAVYSHHHVDHVFGTARFDAEAAAAGWAPPTVYGHADLPDHFRRYRRTAGWNTAINVRQFGLPVDGFAWPVEYRFPDVTYRDALTVRVGELTFELHHARGETDDATWTWVPERRLVHAGDLFIWAVPNAGNPQKVQRYLGDWAAALRAIAARRPEVLVSGHGLPIFGAERIATALADTAELLDFIETRTLALMNAGRSLDEILHAVEIPERLLAKPYLRPVYDHPQFLIRSVWRRFGGWYDGEPDQLLPAPRAEQARTWVALAGGEARVLDRAAELAAGGDLRLACHLVEFAVLADPASAAAHAARAGIYERRAAAQTSSMARNILRHAARSSAQGQRDITPDL